jgi:hypothetical protein
MVEVQNWIGMVLDLVVVAAVVWVLKMVDGQRSMI